MKTGVYIVIIFFLFILVTFVHIFFYNFFLFPEYNYYNTLPMWEMHSLNLFIAFVLAHIYKNKSLYFNLKSSKGSSNKFFTNNDNIDLDNKSRERKERIERIKKDSKKV